MSWLDRLTGRPPAPRQPAPRFVDMRSEVLDADIPAASDPEPTVALMELGNERGIASVVVVADGTTSLYTSTGGGTIGAGTHPPVAVASRAFLAAVGAARGSLPPSDDHPLPSPGEVRFNVRWPDGSRSSAGANEAALASGGHPLSGLFVAGHGVITAMREVEESVRGT